MARSRTTFGPGNTAALGAHRHGAYSPTAIQQLMPAKIAELQERYAEEVPYLTPADSNALYGLAWTECQMKLIDDRYPVLVDGRGKVKSIADLRLRLAHAQREYMKVLAVGPAARAQMMQSMAGAGRDALEVKAAQERLRAKQALRIAE